MPWLLLFASLALAQQAPARKTLILGDSHTVGAMGVTVDDGLRKRYGNDKVATYAVCSASIQWWLNANRRPWNICYYYRGYGQTTAPRDGGAPAPAIDALLPDDLDLAVIALGSNSDGPTLDYTLSAGMLLLTKLPAKTRCVWIGPPNMPDLGNWVDEFYRVFPEIVKQGNHACQLIDSRRLTNPAQATRSHYGGAAGKAWGQGVLDQIAP